MINLGFPPQTEPRQEWAEWFNKVYQMFTTMQLPVKTDATRGDPGLTGRVIFNVTDSNLNIDNGTNWILPDGSIT